MLDKPETDTKGRIVATAERLFREIGYQKTTVADIAKALKMSPANVYRFFDSKKSIHEAVAERLTAEVQAQLRAVAARPGPAADRMRQILRGSHEAIVAMGVHDAKMMEMVEVAMTESWSVIEAHIAAVDAIFAGLIAEGIAEGAFRPLDVTVAAACTRAAMVRFCHPAIVVECAGMPLPTLDDQIEFVMRSLQR